MSTRRFPLPGSPRPHARPASPPLLALLLRVLPVALLAGAALWSSPATASARSPESVGDITDLSRVIRVAEALTEDPLYVHPSVPDLDRWHEDWDELSGRVAEGLPEDTPLYVVYQPSVITDETGGQPTLFLHALHEQSGADGVYVALTNDRRAAVAAFNSAITPDPALVSKVHRISPEATIEGIVTGLEESPRTHVSATGLVRDPDPDLERAVQRPWTRSADFWGHLPLGVMAGLITVALFLRLTRGMNPSVLLPRLPRPFESLRRRSGARIHSSSGVTAARVPNRLRRWRLRPLLARELRILRHRIESTPADHPGLGRAREAYDAAGLVAVSPKLPPTALVCAVVLARHGERALEHPEEPYLRPCQVNPLHGTARHSSRLALGGRSRVWELCSRCERRESGVGEALLVRVRQRSILLGWEYAYFRDHDDLWAKNTFSISEPFERARREIGV